MGGLLADGGLPRPSSLRIGWRGMAMLGLSVTLFGLLALAVRARIGGLAAAKGGLPKPEPTIATHLGLPLQSVPLPTTLPASAPRGRLSDLLATTAAVLARPC